MNDQSLSSAPFPPTTEKISLPTVQAQPHQASRSQSNSTKPSYFYQPFKGRISRKDYIFGIILVNFSFAVFLCIAALLTSVMSRFVYNSEGFILFILKIYIFIYIFSLISLTIRRLHDLDMRGWLILLHGIPIIGTIALFYLLCSSGSSGDNKYGNSHQKYSLKEFIGYTSSPALAQNHPALGQVSSEKSSELPFVLVLFIIVNIFISGVVVNIFSALTAPNVGMGIFLLAPFLLAYSIYAIAMVLLLLHLLKKPN